MERLLSQHYYSVGILFHFRFGDLLAFSGWRVSKPKEIETRMRLSTWVLGNGEDARTAVSHAGRLFGLLRDHPCHGYHEPSAGFLASLCLWVYSMSQSGSLLGPFGRCLSANCESQQMSEQTRDAIPFRIDQDSSTKLTKEWISRGCHIRCFLGGVGSLHKPEFSGRVLDQGIRLISSLNEWETGEPLASVLRRQVK
ncbi:fungal transcription factor [Colletotrichum tofieldiae]|nr:fungal transcription factor [Colletotrichum tofieldiae]GKT74379.1 fungal transcription factor [Colletotrichum tofieldiae]